MAHTKNATQLMLPLFDQFIADSKKGKRLQPNGVRISNGTIKNYESTAKLLKSFASTNKLPLRLRSIYRLNSKDRIIEKNYWKKFYRHFTDYLYNEQEHFDNYVGQTIKNIRVFFNYLNKEKGFGTGDYHKLFYRRKENIAIHPLSPKELNFLVYDQRFGNSLTPRMKEVKDLFVFGCTVALRVSDLFNLKKSNLRIINNHYYLSVRSVKTKTESLILLPPYAVDIINKYKNVKGKLLPNFNHSNLNKYIKLLLELAGFTYPIFQTREKRGRTIELRNNERSGPLRFCDVATTHTMRRTAITTMLSLGMPEQIVRQISGHSEGGKDFYRYVAWSQNYKDQASIEVFNKLQNVL